MECHCFNQILSTNPTLTTFVKDFLKVEKKICSRLCWELNRHILLNAAILLNTTYAKKPSENLTELKVKKEFDCFHKKFQITSFKKLINRHFVALNILEFQVNSTNQPQFLIKIADPFKNLLCKGVFDNSNSI